jgi:uncharacterized membrane protein YfcA
MPPELPILLAGCFVAAFASGMAGFAFNLVAAGILFHWLPPQETAPVLVLGSLLIQLGTVGTVWRSIRWPVLRPYLIGGVLGTPFGVLILRVTDSSVIVAGIGLLLVGYSGYMLSRILLRRAPPLLHARPGAWRLAWDARLQDDPGRRVPRGTARTAAAVRAVSGDLGRKADDADDEGRR